MTFPEVEAWVRGRLPPPPARVVEIGAGDGELARSLREGGYDVTAIDPGSEAPDVLPLALADLPVPVRPFDAAVAVVSLHHVDPLEPSVERLAAAMAPGAPLLLDELDVDVLDERAAAWWLEQRRARGADEHGAHHEHAEHDEPETPAELVATMRARLHSLARLSSALTRWYEVGEATRGTYLYRWKLDESLRPLEEQLVGRGELPRVGVRVVARRR